MLILQKKRSKKTLVKIQELKIISEIITVLNL